LCTAAQPVAFHPPRKHGLKGRALDWKSRGSLCQQVPPGDIRSRAFPFNAFKNRYLHVIAVMQASFSAGQFPAAFMGWKSRHALALGQARSSARKSLVSAC
jgi:hypothetical protein